MYFSVVHGAESKSNWQLELSEFGNRVKIQVSVTKGSLSILVLNFDPVVADNFIRGGKQGAIFFFFFCEAAPCVRNWGKFVTTLFL